MKSNIEIQDVYAAFQQHFQSHRGMVFIIRKKNTLKTQFTTLITPGKVFKIK